ncbi:MAG: hypothetical protein OEZ01_01390 [Candidatus Heimdallarchaeota archaeon]|nr:hypothetical protein [Candidatus Heimdallarchaeota archaeon]MDH5644627.1 hypothetical protein [Candidatus Heimdallarchaeota archaeon]
MVLKLISEIKLLFESASYSEIRKIINNNPNQPELILYELRLLRAQAEYKDCLKLATQSFDKFKDEPLVLAEIYTEVCMSYWFMGKLFLVNIYLKKVKHILFQSNSELLKHENYKYVLSIYYHILAVSSTKYKTTTEIIETYKKSIKLKEEIGENEQLAIGYNNIGHSYWQNNELDIAIHYLQKSYLINQKIKNEENQSLNLINLIQIMIQKEELNLANDYLIRLKEIYERNNQNKLVDRYFHYCHAYILSRSNSFRDKVQAEDTFRDIIYSEFKIAFIHIRSIYHLCELYLYQLKLGFNEDVFNEFNILIDLLHEYGLETELYLVMHKASLLVSKLLIIQNKFTEAKEILLRLIEETREYGDRLITNLISIELEKLLDLEKLDTISDNTAEKLKNDRSLDNIITSFLSNTKIPNIQNREKPVALVILRDDGLHIYSRIFDHKSEFNTHLVSNFLSAMNSFGNEIFGSQDGFIEKLKYMDHYITIRRRGDALYSYIFKNETTMSIYTINQVIAKLSIYFNNLNSVIVIDKEQRKKIDNIIDEIIVNKLST